MSVETPQERWLNIAAGYLSTIDFVPAERHPDVMRIMLSEAARIANEEIASGEYL